MGRGCEVNDKRLRGCWRGSKSDKKEIKEKERIKKSILSQKTPIEIKAGHRGERKREGKKMRKEREKD